MFRFGNAAQIYTKPVPLTRLPARIVNTPTPSLTQELVNLSLRIAIVVLFIVAIAFGFAARAAATLDDERSAQDGNALAVTSPPADDRAAR